MNADRNYQHRFLNSKILKFILIFVLLIIVLFALATSAVYGAWLGFQNANMENEITANTAEALYIAEQYSLANQEYEAGEYELAEQRLEYVINEDPNYPGAIEKLTAVKQILYATATPTTPPPSPTPTSTPDLRPIYELYDQAERQFLLSDWDEVITTITALRNLDLQYQVVKVDAMLYQVLRHRGVDKIRNQRSLEGGIFDLALAENFAPLDAEASNWRNLARLYMIGLGYWEVYPEQAVYYFQQVASAAPYMLDSSGWTARERYRAALIQLADQLMSEEEWCAAEEYYLLALSIRSEISIEERRSFVSIKCSPPTATPAPSTATPTATFTIVVDASPTATGTLGVVITPTATEIYLSPTPTSPPALTATAVPSETPLPSPTVITTEEPLPTDTPVPTETPPSSESSKPTQAGSL
jgi:flagellar basal body-associated protein FliL